MARLGWLTDRLAPPRDVVTRLDGARLVRTPGLPQFWFGNFLELDAPPAPGELAGWLERWRGVVGEPLPQRIVLSWETAEPALSNELVAEAKRLGFTSERNVVLRLERLAEARPPDGFVARPAESDADWDGALAVTLAEDASESDFSARRQAGYRERAEAGGGAWWVGELDGQIVTNAGIYWDETGLVARYQRVDTRADARGRGCASALLQAMALDVQGRFPQLAELVIVAEVGGAGERVYRRLGFVTESFSQALVAPVPG